MVMEKIIRHLLLGVLVFQVSGCGTLLYPERRNQRAGRLDVGIVILDAIGLLFFLIPGIIAFAIDFSNGTIYLPATGGIGGAGGELRQIKFDPERATLAEIEGLIKDNTGRDIKMTQSGMKVTRLPSTHAMNMRFALAREDMAAGQLARNK